MTDDTANLILTSLRRLDAKIDRLQADLDDLKYRVSSLEQQIAGLRMDLAHYSTRQDSFELRLRRIEHRLDLREPD